MILYLIKSVTCLLILLLVHRLILQREAIYKFNRFFLLAAVIGSFLIPMVEIEVVEKEIETPQFVTQEISSIQEFPVEPYPELIQESVSEVVVAEKPLDWSLIFWTIYGLITLVFFIRFVRNINLLIDKINRNVHVQFRGETLVLLKEQSLPFSFLSYIFVSKEYFESDLMTDAVFAHEQAHVHGRHSWDNLLIESLLIFFWFHPGLYLARQAIKLNHEFIADEAALQITPLDQYKSFLLHMMLPERSHGLASSLNFSLTKKRFEMMKRSTKSSTKWITFIVLIPLISALVYFFGEKVKVKSEEEGIKSSIPLAADSKEKVETKIRILSDRIIEVDGETIPIEELSKWLDEIKASQPIVRFSANPGVKMGMLADVQEVLRKMDIRQVIYEAPQNRNEPESKAEQKKEAYYRNAYFLIEDSNMVYTHKTYAQLSEKEKRGLFGPMKAREKEHPDPDLFQSWKDNKTYAIWIDGVVIPNEKLNSYSSEDFAGFFQSSVKENARSRRFPQPYQVHLYSDSYYDKEFGPNSARRQPLTSEDTITLTSRLVTWHKDIQKYPDPTTAFLQKYARYENLRTTRTIYDQKSPEEKELLDKLYQELDIEYSQSSDKRKKSLKQPIPPDSDTLRNGNSTQNSSENIAVRNNRSLGGEELIYEFASSNGDRSSSLQEYLKHYGEYQTVTYENRLFAQPVRWAVLHQQKLFRALEAKYNELSFDDRRRVKRATFPYVKMEKDGREVFLKVENLTPQQRKELGC